LVSKREEYSEEVRRLRWKRRESGLRRHPNVSEVGHHVVFLSFRA
jgi:hypothetical protein